MTRLKLTALHRWLRIIGRLPVPRIEGIYSRLGVLGDSKPRHFTTQFAGLEYQGCLDQLVDRYIYFFGAYAPAELDFLYHAVRALRDGVTPMTFVDVGANVGQHSLFMSKQVDRVLAFEPNNNVADQFEANLRINHLENVEVLRHALGRADGYAELGSGLEGNSGSRSLVWSTDESKNTRVQVRRADVALQDLGVGRVDLLKIDVEGYEREVLAGLRYILQRDRPVVLFELVGNDVKGGFRSESELREALYQNHSLFTLVGTRKARLIPFDWASEEAVCIPSEIVNTFGSLTRTELG